MANFKQNAMNRFKTHTQKTVIVIVFISLSMTTNSCSLFRKKNKCDTCPTWSNDNIETRVEFS